MTREYANSPTPERSSKRDDLDKLSAEDRAKGHDRGVHMQSEFEPAHAKDQKETEQKRGHQKGYGRNQRDEGMDRHTPRGTHSGGGGMR